MNFLKFELKFGVIVGLGVGIVWWEFEKIWSNRGEVIKVWFIGRGTIIGVMMWCGGLVGVSVLCREDLKKCRASVSVSFG